MNPPHTFWMVYGAGQRTPTARHHTAESALIEARPEDIAEQVGRRTTSLMSDLGDILNGMDAASGEDEWTYPIFHEAARRWPGGA